MSKAKIEHLYWDTWSKCDNRFIGKEGICDKVNYCAADCMERYSSSRAAQMRSGVADY